MKAGHRHDHDYWIVGYNPVKEALSSPDMAVKELVLARRDQRSAELGAKAEERGASVRYESHEAISALTGHTHHQGLAARAGEFRYAALDPFLQRPVEERQPLLILDSIQDPQNLGALIRSACFLGAKGMIIPKDRSAGITAAVVKVASGGTVHLPLIQVVNLVHTLGHLKDSGLWIVGLDLEGRQPLYEADLSPPLGLVVGNEQKGLRPLVRKHCDFLVRIPALGPLQSLNAATAGAIALAEVQRQRHTAKTQGGSRRGPCRF
jgi:23S rRNA (guanosine2251-2'-O)-methyltransferase